MNCNTVAESLCLLHGVCRQNDCLVCRTLLDNLPEVALGSSINSRRGLVHKQQRRLPDQRDANTQLALHTATVCLCRFIRIGIIKSKPTQQSLYHLTQLCLWNSLDTPVKHQVFTSCDILPNRIHL